MNSPAPGLPTGFSVDPQGRIWLCLSDQERELVGQLLGQLSELLAPDDLGEPADPLAALVGIQPEATRPEDPALARLLPDAYDDPDLADEFRRFAESDLRTAKLDSADRCAATLARPDPTELTGQECQDWLRSLTDLRLALGTRLGLAPAAPGQVQATPASRQDPPSRDDPRFVLFLVYDWLTVQQELLVEALTSGLDR